MLSGPVTLAALLALAAQCSGPGHIASVAGKYHLYTSRAAQKGTERVRTSGAGPSRATVQPPADERTAEPATVPAPIGTSMGTDQRASRPNAARRPVTLWPLLLAVSVTAVAALPDYDGK